MKFPHLLLSACLVFSGCASTPSPQSYAALPKPVCIFSVRTEPPNSAGGVSVGITWQNTGTRTIKYMHFLVTAISRVGDPAPSEITGSPSTILRDTGPFVHGQKTPGWQQGGYWENAWYNNTITSARIDKLEIEYMDGAPETFEGASLTALFSAP